MSILRRVPSRLGYANVIATVALFLALGGTSYALVVNGALVQDESLTGADVRNASLTGADVADDSLKGADVDESSLAEVPFARNAASAGSAFAFDGATITQQGKSGAIVGGGTETITCSEDGVALRGSHFEERPPTSAVESYTRSSYSVTYEFGPGDPAFPQVILAVKCMTIARPANPAGPNWP